jgi:hypothetical protein
MKKLSERALSNKEETVQKCEHQIAEMMATLEKYQQENQKIVCQKDKEIEEMRHSNLMFTFLYRLLFITQGSF